MPSPRENSALWEYVVIGSVVLPPDGVEGHARVKAPIEFELDPKKAKGKNGSRTTSQGRKGATAVEIEVTFKDALTTTGDSQYDLVNDAISRITEKPGPYGIAHGATDFAAVKDVMIESVSSPEWDGGQGKIVIKAQRWDAPATVAGGKGSGAPASLLAQLAAAEAELAALLASNIQDQTAVLLAQSKVLSLKALIGTYGTATSTPTKSDPTKSYSQGGGPSTPGIPLGEIQPTGTV